MLLRMTDINKFYNGNQVLSHVSLTVEDHDRIGLEAGETADRKSVV